MGWHNFFFDFFLLIDSLNKELEKSLVEMNIAGTVVI